MNFSHLHLLLNHVPLIGLPLATLFFFYGLKIKNSQLQKFALIIITLIGASVLPVYFSGEPAEKLVKHLPEVSEAFIEPHEEAAEAALILTVLTGLAALAALYLQKDEKKLKIANTAVLIVSVLAIGSLAYTGNAGGKIRHTEIREIQR